MSNPFTAFWIDDDSNLNKGHWEIFYLGQWLELSEKQKGQSLAEDICEDAWLIENEGWLNELFSKYGISADETHRQWFYRAVNAHDWRCGSFHDYL